MTTPLFTTPRPHEITLDTLPQLLAHHRERFGGWRMEDDPEPKPDPKPDPAPEPKPDPKPGDGEKRFDQAAVDKMIGDRLAAEKKKFDEQLAEMQANAGKSEKEKAEAERDKYKTQAEGAVKAAGERVARTEAKLAARTGGARDDRLDAVLKQADLTEVVGEDGTVDEEKVKAAVEAVLAEYPEWKRTPGSSGKEHDDGPGEKKTWTRAQVKAMSPAERAANIDELNKAMAEGRITG